ncbi:MAG: DUF115 domain-containing protein [Proteobacteria bacterium]|nr:DUF115 domain-containing protein [Pseudomonadota bacterium]
MSGPGRTDLKDKNLKAFQRLQPDLYEALRAFKPASTLSVGENGEADVIINAKPFYGGKIREFTAEQIKQFWDVGPSRFIVEQPIPENNDIHTNRFLDRIITRAEEAGIAFTTGPSTRQSYFLVILGTGLGQHIDELIEATDCQVLVIADHSLEFLFHSLEVYDWHRILDTFANTKTPVLFIIEGDPAQLSKKIWTAIRNANPISIDGFTCFIHDRSPAIMGAIDGIVQNMSMILFGLGFFYDESLMIRNAYGNLCDGKAKIYRRPDNQRLDVPVFVIATGPSLDEAMPFLKENADKAVIVSSGSAIRSLVVNGIMPDFQVETENISVFPVIVQAAEECDISSICLITASTVDQSIIPYFENSVYFFRAGLSTYPLFCESEQNSLQSPDPTVVNASLSFAIEAGFKDIYLFGVDMGGRESGSHHSKDSYHYTDGAIVVESDLTFDIPVEGNFGGKFVTSKGLYAARYGLSQTMIENQSRHRFFNCSDGARIDGAEPRRMDTVSLPAIKDGKEKTVWDLISGFPVYSRQQFEAAWDEDKFMAAIDAFIDKILAAINNAENIEDKAYLTELMTLMPILGTTLGPLSNRIENAVMMMFRGTIIMLVGALEYYLNRVTAPEKMPLMKDIVREELVTAVNGLRQAAKEILSNAAEVPDPAGTGDIGVKNLIPEVPHTWGTVGRNEPCPCGSGRKFKHCHGKIK